MIKLENISINEFRYLLTTGSKDINKQQEYLAALRTLDKYHVENYEQLRRLVIKGNPEFNTDTFKSELMFMMNKVLIANESGIEPELYFTNGYDQTMNERTLHFTDQNTNGRLLICKSPLLRNSKKSRVLGFSTIEELKFVISHLRRSDLRNTFRLNVSGFDKDDMQQLVASINLYEEQVMRQYRELGENLPSELINLFDYNKKAKDIIVESQLKEITEYLMDSGTHYVWGDLSDTARTRLSKAVNDENGNPYVRRNVIDLVSNYTTLSELEQGVVKKKTLDRFIVK